MIKNDEVAKKSTLVDCPISEGAFFSLYFSFRLKPHRDSPFLTFFLVGSATLIVGVTNTGHYGGTNRLSILVVW